MTPEAANYLAKSSEELSDTRTILAIGLSRHAARSAYYAMFHAAEALIFERTGKIAKTHSGVRTEFARLLMHATDEHRELASILGIGYKFKELSDYGVGASASISKDEAQAVVDAAERFLREVRELLR